MQPGEGFQSLGGGGGDGGDDGGDGGGGGMTPAHPQQYLLLIC